MWQTSLVLNRLSLLPGQYFGWEEAQEVVDKLRVGQAFLPTWPIFWMGGGSRWVDKLSVEQAFPPTWPIFWMGGGSRPAHWWPGLRDLPLPAAGHIHSLPAAQEQRLG